MTGYDFGQSNGVLNSLDSSAAGDCCGEVSQSNRGYWSQKAMRGATGAACNMRGYTPVLYSVFFAPPVAAVLQDLLKDLSAGFCRYATFLSFDIQSFADCAHDGRS